MVLALARVLRYIDPSAEEIAFLQSLPGPELTLSAGDIFPRSHDRDDLYLLLDGWAVNAAISADGAERIHSVHLPGDMVGMANLVLDAPSDAIYALTAVQLKQLSCSVLREMFERFHRLAAVTMLIAQEERALKHEWNLLHTATATSRFAGFLYRINERVNHLNEIAGFDRTIPLTQKQIAEAVGVTPAYINRLIQTFRANDLIKYQRSQLQVLDHESLGSLSALHEWRVEKPKWLPAPT